MSNRLRAPSENNSVNAVAAMAAIATHWRSFTAVALVPPILAIVVAVLATPIYRVEATLAPTASDISGGLGDALGMLGGLPAAGLDLLGGDGDRKSDHGLALLTSNDFLRRFIEENNLLPVIFFEDWDEEHGDWEQSWRGPPTTWDAINVFRDEVLTVRQDRKTSFVVVAVEWKDRERAAAWVTQLVQRVNEGLRERAIDEADESLRYLNEQIETTTAVELRSALFELVESQTKQRMMASVRDEYVFETIDPPVLPDEDDFEHPQRLLIIVFGFVVSCLLVGSGGILLATLNGAQSETLGERAVG